MSNNKKMRKDIALGKSLQKNSTQKKCRACGGSGYYDNNGSPKCSSCNGTGYEMVGNNTV